MAEINAVDILLKHIGPSMRVTGKTSALPAGDRVGTLLSHITPSMGARLARESVRQPHPSCSRPCVGLPSTAQVLRARQAHLTTQPAGSTVAPAARAGLGPGFRARPIDPTSVTGAARTVGASPSGEPGAYPPADRTDSHRLGWPWTGPLPAPAPPPPATCPYPVRQPPVVGEMIDLFA